MRSLTSLLLTLGLGALAATKPLSGHKTTRPFLAALGVLGAFAMALWYVSLEHLPLGDAVVISLVGPPLTALLAFFLLKEALGWVGAAGCLAAFAGVVVVSQPPFLFGETETSPTSPSPLSSTHGHALGVGAGVLAALATSCAMLAIRRIGGSEPAIVVTLAFHVASVAMGSASLLLGIPAPPQHPSSRNAGLLVTTGAVTFIAQLLVTRSFQLLPAAVAASLAFTGVAYAYLAGAVFFGEKLALPAALGTVLITSGVALATLRRPPPKTAAVAEAGVVVAVPLQGAAAITLPSRRRLITQHSITACGDGGALFGTDLFVAVEPPQTGAVAADAHPLLLPPASSPSTATASPFAAPVAPAALADEPTALEALAADPLVAAAARLYTRASMSFRRQGSVGGTSLSRGGSASSSLAALRQISSLVRRVDKEEAAATVVAAAPEAAALVPAAATAAIDDKDDQT
jgi:drug/metabolite transporter (DMT)-like permease